MAFTGQTVVVTGGLSGIGAALVRQFEALGARVCVFDIVDVPASGASITAYVKCDVSVQQDLRDAIQKVEREVGAIDIFVSNAGVMSAGPPLGDGDDWARCLSVNLMAHVYAARVLIPLMAARGGGYLVTVASAAGLLNQIGDAAYSASKHAAVSFAESIAITHAEDNIGVSLVCPQYVATPLLGLTAADIEGQSLLTADQVADRVLHAVKARQFLVLPHPEVRTYALARAEDHDRWVSGMRKLRARSIKEYGDALPRRFYRLV
ncbi:KR domain-containing protein [Roseobacter denitrificans]|uniref:Putative dehydrogenase n=1 Tax=Roseobacter denitrificans (strain ATCC 33942 / OCh 114) TaxID=375451 RepID=Q16D12_ROSDO|nr:SDR family NAD(P)-dependent oxidoreductase [Roseobacter denitrificans]ABG30131.1 putative dehydrogenase [Roseobacter denitrificans OCh 114]AVL53324.1 KR domain-containing protein [Roseobacter denitrificans]SFF69893.1 Short-chain dehydrogenase [Roseobacter denitrificans OCh 114]